MLSVIGEKRLLWPAIAALAGLAVLIALGTWQMQRLHWKEGLIGAIKERVHAKPVTMAEIEERAGLGGDVEYARVALEGQFLHENEIHLYAIDSAQGPGFHIITPLRLADGSIVLVNRGFVPNDLKDPAKRPEGQLTGDVKVVGLVRHPDKQAMFDPSNDPKRNIWYWRDIEAMAAATDADPSRVHGYIVDAEAEPTPPGGWPKGGTTRLELPNRHLEYALTWYGLAAALVAVFAVFAVGRWRQPPAE